MSSDETPITKASRYTELGVASDYSPNWGIRQDEFIADLRGTRGIKRLREMASNDPIVGAILSAMDLMIRTTPWRIEGGSDEARSMVEYSLHNMENATFEEFISDVLSFLPYGFSLFEMVARRPSDASQGWVTIKKLAPRAQWTIERFDVNDTGDLTGVYQTAAQSSGFIPYSKLLHFRTVSRQGDPAGVSVLRSAYLPWYYANRLREIEAVAIERELNGIPLIRIPSEYLQPDATDAQKAFLSAVRQIGRDVKKNEQGYIIVPSDVYEDRDGKLTSSRMVEFELVASSGKRDIDTHQVILRYQMDIARSALADFVMLGVNDRGSFALSKSKADLFLKALEGYVDSIAAVLNRRLVPMLMLWNGLPLGQAPKIKHGRVAPTDLAELGAFAQRLGNLGLDLTDDTSEDFLREAAGMPPARPRADRPDEETAADADDDPDEGDEIEKRTYQPPEAAKNNARRVLEWKRKHGSDVKGMTAVGWARARQLASGKPISRDTVARMSAFNRHRKNAAVDPKFRSEPWKDRGYVAWLGWGGTTGVDWARGIMQGVNKASGAEPIYMYRPVLNAEQLHDWARSQGFTSALEPDDMHTTVVFSKTPFNAEFSAIARYNGEVHMNNVVVRGGRRTVAPLGDKGAVVLKIESPELQDEHAFFRGQGASWDFPSYTPHITITYRGVANPEAMTPFEGDIVLGPLRAKPLNTDWDSEIVEVDLTC